MKLPSIRSKNKNMQQLQSYPFSTLEINKILGDLREYNPNRKSQLRYNTQTSQSYTSKKMKSSFSIAKAPNPTLKCQDNLKDFAFQKKLLAKQFSKVSLKQLDKLSKEAVNLQCFQRRDHKKSMHLQLNKRVRSPPKIKINRISNFQTERTEARENEEDDSPSWFNRQLNSSFQKEISEYKKYRELSLSQILEKECDSLTLVNRKKSVKVKKKQYAVGLYEGW